MKIRKAIEFRSQLIFFRFFFWPYRLYQIENLIFTDFFSGQRKIFGWQGLEIKFIKKMRRIDRIIPNKVIHDPSNNFMFKGRNLIYTPAPHLSMNNAGAQDSYEVGCLAYSMRKENEALTNYLRNDKNTASLPAGLQSHFHEAMQTNTRCYSDLYNKLKSQLKYDNAQPISTFIECLYLGSIMNDMTVDYYNKYLESFISEKLEFASKQNLMDLVISLHCLEVDPSDPTLTKAHALLQQKLSVSPYPTLKFYGKN